MSNSFENQVAQIAAEYKRDLVRIRNRATMNVVNDAQLERTRGGRMPVVTGNLRRSIRAALGTAPDDRSGSPAAVIARAGLSSSIVIGWTANYAWVNEIRRGFMRVALQNWQTHVKAAVKEVRG